jgi:nucleotide-binding universal stress UspA family protein
VEKRILIAVDGSNHSRKAIEYTVKMESLIKDLHYSLLNIQPKISEFLIEDAKMDGKARAALKKVISQNQAKSTEILNESKEIMKDLGIDESRIDLVSQPIVMGVAKGILDFGSQALADAIVMGRRGLSRLAETFIGSVTNSVLEHTNVTPVWAVGGTVTSSKVMIAVDGSESALRAVDHAAFFLANNSEIDITLLHIAPRLRDYCTIDFDDEGDPLREVIAQGDKKCIDTFYTQAKQKFLEAGLKENQINIQQVTSKVNIGKTIVKEAEEGEYGTLIVGRRGANNSFFMGSVSRHILSNASNCAVWLVP